MKKAVFISGGSKGIGAAIAEKLASENYRTIVSYKTNKIKAEELVNKIKDLNGDAQAIFCDISNRDSIVKVFSEIGSIDILVNNASITQHKSFLDISDEDWSRMQNVNLQGAFMCSQTFIPGMLKKKWGRIINIASIGGQWGGIDQVHYASAKAGLIGLSMSLARIYSNTGITSNSVAPGIIITETTSIIKENEKKQLIKNIPLGRFGISTEVAQAVSFLASDNSSYITGQTINVNGGMLRS